MEARTVTSFQQALIRSRQLEQNAPCRLRCASGTDVRGWIALVAQRGKLGLSEREAMTRAWAMVSAVNPFPATLGRICPHPCEDACSRSAKDGAVAVNALERFLGDWGLEQRLRLPRLEKKNAQPESIGVIGAGPAGLSFAYQMARRGYRVTVYEKEKKPGGMLYHGIPQYRLPEHVLEAEIMRILDLGVDLKLEVAVGRDLAVPQLRAWHNVVFLGIGAGKGIKLDIPQENGPAVWTGTEYLAKINRGEALALGNEVVIVGG
ncbi:MAG: FAD-dependent oxidoreductase, partial [Betaproteobacteria bacterium]|nr:FAD-dependent oxidoreductase [Betaproteobacteria bacterium]